LLGFHTMWRSPKRSTSKIRRKKLCLKEARKRSVKGFRCRYGGDCPRCSGETHGRDCRTRAFFKDNIVQGQQGEKRGKTEWRSPSPANYGKVKGLGEQRSRRGVSLYFPRTTQDQKGKRRTATGNALGGGWNNLGGVRVRP